MRRISSHMNYRQSRHTSAKSLHKDYFCYIDFRKTFDVYKERQWWVQESANKYLKNIWQIEMKTYCILIENKLVC